MTDSQGNLPPAGWYPDPYGAPYERWWDGAQWTDHTNVPAAPEPAVVAPAAPAAPVYPTTEPAYQAPAQAAYQAPAQTTEPAYQAPAQTAEPAYQAPTAEPAYQAPTSSFDDIFATGQAPTQSAQSAYGQPAAAQQEQPSYQSQQPAYDPFASAQPGEAQYQGQQYQAQQYEQTPVANAGPDFASLITGGGAGVASGSSDPFDSWSNQDYEEPPRNTPATVGLTFGVLSFIIPGVAGLVGLITSSIGLVRAARFKKEEGVALGRGKSIAGLVLSVIGSAASVAAVIFLLPGILNPAETSTGDDSSGVVAPAPKTTNNNIDLVEGATGTVLFSGTTDPSIQFTVTGITANPTCTEDAELVLSPENGQFVAFTMEFTTAENYSEAMDSGGLLQVAASDFVGLLPDGTAVTNSSAGRSCFPEAEQLPTEIAAGSTVSGTVILDVTPETTSFSYAPRGVTELDPSTTRWEWAIAR